MSSAMNKHFNAAILLACVLFPQSNTSAQEEVPIETTLRAIVAHPRLYDHKLVSFTAALLSAMHGTALYDCQALGMTDLQSWSQAHGVSDLDNVLNVGFIGSLGKTITAKWTGRLSWHTYRDSQFRYSIEVTNIQAISAASLKYHSRCKTGNSAWLAPRPLEFAP
jgi:hypothetical protein